MIIVDELKNVYPAKNERANDTKHPTKYIINSVSTCLNFLKNIYTPYINILKNGTKYNTKPIIPKFNKNAGISISKINSP